MNIINKIKKYIPSTLIRKTVKFYKPKPKAAITVDPSINRTAIIDALTGHIKVLENMARNKDWKAFIEYIKKKLPTKTSLECLVNSKKDNDSQNLEKLILSIDKLFQRVYKKLHHSDQKFKSPAEKEQADQLIINFLKAWYCYSPEFDPLMQKELAVHIIENMDDHEDWLYFTIGQLDKIKQKLSRPFIEKLKNLTHVKFNKKKHTDLSNMAKETARFIANTQLCLNKSNQFGFAHLNLARSAMDYDFGYDPSQEPQKEAAKGHNYVEWQLEMASKTGMELPHSDMLTLAYSLLIKKEYSGVLETLKDLPEDTHEDIVSKATLFTGMAHSRLWLDDNPDGDVQKAIHCFSKLSKKGELKPNNQFLFCRILIGIKDLVRAKEEFVSINLEMLEAPIEDIADIARAINSFEMIESFVRHYLEQTPDSLPALSIYCELLRSHLNKFSESLEIINRIKQLNPMHEWVKIMRAHEHIENGKPAIARKIASELDPGTDEPFKTETDFITARIALAENNIYECRQLLAASAATHRYDHVYLRALIEANNNNAQNALNILSEIRFEDYYEKKIYQFKGLLLFSLKQYKASIQALDNIHNEQALFYKALGQIETGLFEDALLTVSGHEKFSRLLFTKALSLELTQDMESAITCYKKFITNVDETDPYFAVAVNRLAWLVIETENEDHARRLLNSRKTGDLISSEYNIHLNAVCREWQTVLTLSKQNARNRDNIMYACQEILKQHITDKKWEEAKTIAVFMEENFGPVDEVEDIILTEELFDTLQKSSEGFDYARYGELDDISSKLAIELHKKFNGANNIDLIVDLYKKSSDQEQGNSMIIMAMMAIAMERKDKNLMNQLTSSLENNTTENAQTARELICKSFISIVNEANNLPLTELKENFTTLNTALPVTAKSFWSKIVAAGSRTNFQTSAEILRLAMNEFTLDQNVKLGVLALSAKNHIKKGDEAIAVQELEKAVEEMEA